MKLFAVIAATVSASAWPGQHTDGIIGAGQACGVTAAVTAKAVNSTCTFATTMATSFVSIAGAFKTGGSTFTGFEGATPEDTLQVLVFWAQTMNAAGDDVDNSTAICGTDADVTITCVDNGVPTTTANLVGNFMMDPRNPSYQVPVANADESFAIDLSAHGAVTNATCNGAVDALTTAGSYSCDFSDSTSLLNYFAFNGEVSGASNF